MSTTRRLVLTSLTLLLVTALCAPAAQAAGKKSASITAPSVSARTIDAGQSVTVKARTSASLKGKKVVLQLKKGSSWQTIGSAKVTKKRSVTITSKLSAAGRSQALRLHAPGSSKRKAATRSAGSVTVYIGSEVADLEGAELSLVVAPFGDSERGAGTVGVLGPTRMDYARIVPLVDATAAAMTAALKKVD